MAIFGKNSTPLKEAQQLAETVFNGIDSISTTKEEKLKQWNEFSRYLIDAHLQQAEQRTERHKTDMTSDSWLSKNIRPLVLIYLLLLLTTCIIYDAWHPVIPNGPDYRIPLVYIKILESILYMAIGFYFMSRFGTKIAAVGGEAMKTRKQRRMERRVEKEQPEIL